MSYSYLEMLNDMDRPEERLLREIKAMHQAFDVTRRGELDLIQQQAANIYRWTKDPNPPSIATLEARFRELANCADPAELFPQYAKAMTQAKLQGLYPHNYQFKHDLEAQVKQTLGRA